MLGMGIKSVVDWDGVEPHYRAGIVPLKQLGIQFGCSDAAIVKHASKKGWTRNLLGKIQAKADAKVSAALVSAEVSETKKLTEAVRIEVESTKQADIRIAHRGDITRMRKLVLRLLDELEVQTENQDVFENIRELVVDPSDGEDSKASKDRAQKLNEAFNRALSLSGRTKTVKDLSDTIKTLIALEREAYGIDKMPETPPVENIDPLEGARRLAFIFAQAANDPKNKAVLHG
jgi:hypothetical protein